MKKLITLCLGTILILTAFSGNLFAQKATHIDLTAPVVIASTSNLVLNKKAFNSFMLLHPAATDQRWFQLEDNFLVKYIWNENPGRALYTNQGRIIYEINYGTKKDLTPALQELVTNTYAGYDITSAVKVNQHKRELWMITVSNAKNFIILKLDGDQITPGETFDRSL